MRVLKVQRSWALSLVCEVALGRTIGEPISVDSTKPKPKPEQRAHVQYPLQKYPGHQLMPTAVWQVA
jgi:hypothetical protein